MQPYTPQFLCTQAQRTLPTRQFFYQQIEWIDAPLCIDIGCGTGVISKEITHLIMRSTVIGFDIDQNLLDYAVLDNRDNQALHLLLADVTALPFRSAIVDFALAHFTLMWIPNRKQALEEIYVILSPNGSLACVEPDYAGRIEILESRLGIKSKPPFPIVTALTRLGADPFTGGHLPEELAQLAFGEIQFGVLSWTFDAQAIRAEILSEADLLKGKGIDWMVPVFIYTPIFWVYGTKLP